MVGGCGGGGGEGEEERPYQTREGELGHEEVGVGLVAADFFERDGAWVVAAPFALRDGVACFGGV